MAEFVGGGGKWEAVGRDGGTGGYTVENVWRASSAGRGEDEEDEEEDGDDDDRSDALVVA